VEWLIRFPNPRCARSYQTRDGENSELGLEASAARFSDAPAPSRIDGDAHRGPGRLKNLQRNENASFGPKVWFRRVPAMGISRPGPGLLRCTYELLRTTPILATQNMRRHPNQPLSPSSAPPPSLRNHSPYLRQFSCEFRNGIIPPRFRSPLETLCGNRPRATNFFQTIEMKA